jgi:hypothetical protein
MYSSRRDSLQDAMHRRRPKTDKRKDDAVGQVSVEKLEVIPSWAQASLVLAAQKGRGGPTFALSRLHDTDTT